MQRVVSIFLLVALISGCSKSNARHVAFQRGKLSAEENASVQQTIGFRPDSLTYRAIWKQKGTVRHVCLQLTGSFDNWSTPYQVAVFGDDGDLLERTQIDAPRSLEPSSVVQLSPLRIRFHDPSGERKDDVKEAPTSEEWRRRTLLAHEKAEAMLKEELAKVESSGTNTRLVAAVKAQLEEIQDTKQKLSDR